MLAIKYSGKVPAYLIGKALQIYASHWLPNISKEGNIKSQESLDPEITSINRLLLESIVSLLPMEKCSVSYRFLLKLLMVVNIICASSLSKIKLTKREGMQLEKVRVNDFLIPSLYNSKETLYDVDIVMKILEHFMMQGQSPPTIPPRIKRGFERRRSRSSENIDFEFQESMRSSSASHSSKLRVEKLVDGYLLEIARDVNIPLAKLIALVEAIPNFARIKHDDLYKAIDIYLKHMDLWEIESSIQRVSSTTQNGTPTYAEMAKEQEGRAQALELWKPKGTYRLILVCKGCITIFMDNEEDRNKIWSGGPWVIGKQLLRLSPWSPFFDLEKKQNTHALVWVNFLGLGVEFWEADTLMAPGRTLGTPIQVDHSSTTTEFGYFAKVLVDVDPAELVPSKFLVEVEDGDFWQRVELGATPKFCSRYKIIGHTFVECRAIKEQVLDKMPKPISEDDPSNYQEQVDSDVTPVKLINIDALICLDHATPSDGTAEINRSAYHSENTHQLLKEMAVIKLQAALKWADIVDDDERDSVLIAQEGV
ncbi:hypothetical protein GIB67_020118 [Kingdonia uniflora]|uniref:NPH3 domain-containing protein n=1 Tax=Kingdonia uniflora TaxID=39325 RepID=A0A7J7NLB1_9MAGN|nr:hypothetical protein GIB67_020118 [Kingdonia uniflora]